jgi:hypothetical protein
VLTLSDSTLRFVAICVYFSFFVYLTIARVDFIISSLLFMFVSIQTFYLDDMSVLKKILGLYVVVSVLFILYFALGLNTALEKIIPFATDLLHVGFILLVCFRTLALIKGRPDLRGRFKVGLIVALAVPLILGPAFKYALLVPLPCEGIVVAFIDYLKYSVL